MQKILYFGRLSDVSGTSEDGGGFERMSGFALRRLRRPARPHSADRDR